METDVKRRSPHGLFAIAAVALAAAGIVTLAGQQAGLTTPGKIRVLVVEETADRAKLPAEQAAIFTAKAVREYLDSHCVVEDGQPAYRFLDKDSDLAKESADWQKLAKRPHATLPWITVACGSRYFDGPLPKDVDAMLALLQKYGGP